jgi:hypothetical protein
MPLIIEEMCYRCHAAVTMTLHDDGSVAAYRKTCSCSGCGGPYAPGDAYARSVWFLLKVAKAADRLSDCISEFGDNLLAGKCLCTACAEWVENLDGALAVWKELTGQREKTAKELRREAADKQSYDDLADSGGIVDAP